eukprot:1102800-Heterocapsa_arctica.AAC.1
MGRRPEADDHLVAIAPKRILCTRACKILLPTVEPVEDYQYAKKLLETWTEPVDDDATIVFSGKADIEQVEEKKRSAVREWPEGEEGPPLRR